MVIISDIKQIERPNFYIFLCQFCRTSFAAGTGKRIREALSSAPAPAMAYKGIHKVKLKNALNEKRKKLRGFSYSKSMANFEAFCGSFSLSTNLLFLKSVPPALKMAIFSQSHKKPALHQSNFYTLQNRTVQGQGLTVCRYLSDFCI